MKHPTAEVLVRACFLFEWTFFWLDSICCLYFASWQMLEGWVCEKRHCRCLSLFVGTFVSIDLRLRRCQYSTDGIDMDRTRAGFIVWIAPSVPDDSSDLSFPKPICARSKARVWYRGGSMCARNEVYWESVSGGVMGVVDQCTVAGSDVQRKASIPYC